eukprot:s357_g8.t1
MSKDPQVAVMVEICAGSATLSAAAQRRGFQVFPIDHANNRFRAAAAILVVDLAHPDSRQLLPRLFAAVRPSWCHMGLPCGTCSRARERPVSQALQSLGAPNPRPLRGPDNLLGLPGLTQAEQQRVNGANEVYITAELLLYQCFLLDIFLSVENPERSLDIFLSVENPERSWLWALLASLVKRSNNGTIWLINSGIFHCQTLRLTLACMEASFLRPRSLKHLLRCSTFWDSVVMAPIHMQAGESESHMVHGNLTLLMKLFTPSCLHNAWWNASLTDCNLLFWTIHGNNFVLTFCNKLAFNTACNRSSSQSTPALNGYLQSLSNHLAKSFRHLGLRGKLTKVSI